jgi:hypothetical protein
MRGYIVEAVGIAVIAAALAVWVAPLWGALAAGLYLVAVGAAIGSGRR